MKLSKALLFLIIYYIFIVLWWVVLFITGQKTSSSNFYFVLIYGLIPFSGGVLGLLKVNSWGGLSSAMGRALAFLSLGLITWSGGETIWSYYNLVLHVAIPYPSWADASFIVSWPLWIIGVFFLSQATGTKFGLRKKHGKIQLVLIPIIAFLVSYYLLVIIARQGSITLGGDLLKVFFDLAYPVLDVVVLTEALLIYGLSFKFLGGKYKWAVVVTLLAFVINYFADFSFSYTTTIGTYYNGSYSDLLFATAMFIMGFGINSLDVKKIS